jgi:phosphoglycolate phosphatase
MTQVLLFDFDGTIADTLEPAMAIGKKIAAEFGLRQLTNDEIVHFRNSTLRQTVRELRIPLYKIPSMVLRIRQEIHENLAAMRPVSGIEAVLKNCRSQCEGLGIVTANSEENVRWFLRKYDLDFFDFGAFSSAIFGKVSKLRGLIHKHHLDRERILYFGDTIGDIEASRKAGIMVAAVTWGYNTKVALMAANPDYLVTTPEEILEIIKAN